MEKPAARAGFFHSYSGDDLLSHAVTRAVPWALEGLTAVFGMGTCVRILYFVRRIPKSLAPAHPTVREPKSLWQTDITLCQKRADNISARPWRPRSDYSPLTSFHEIEYGRPSVDKATRMYCRQTGGVVRPVTPWRLCPDYGALGRNLATF
jgi:hypothetical protein